MYKDTIKFAERETPEGKVILQILPDTDLQDPREWESIGTMICWHRRYELGDKHNYEDSRDMLFDLLHTSGYDLDPEDCEHSDSELMQMVREQYVVLPLYLYDHSGITMSVSSFNDRWDSGQVGWIYVKKAKVQEEFEIEDIGIAEAKAEELLGGEVFCYDQYLRGDVYGYFLTKETTCECCGQTITEDIDSCWGFFGHNFKENGLADQIPSEYSSMVDELEYN